MYHTDKWLRARSCWQRCHPSPARAFRINNAGTNTYKFGPLTSLSNEELSEIVTTNVLGVMLCCKEVGTMRCVLGCGLSLLESTPFTWHVALLKGGANNAVCALMWSLLQGGAGKVRGAEHYALQAGG